MIRLRQVAMIAPDLDPLLLVGDQFLEVLSPTEPGTTVQRLLDKRNGAGGYMAIFEVDDLDERLDRLAANDVRVVWAGDLPDIRGRHLHPRDVGGTLVSIDQPVPAGAWRWGGPDWQNRSDELLAGAAVTAIAGAVIAADDPRAIEARWTQLGLDGDVSFVSTGPRGAGLDGVELIAADPGERTEIGGVTFTLV